MNLQLRQIGFWSASLAAFFGFAYTIPQVLSGMHILGHPYDLFWMFLPSLFLAPTFLVAMICLHYSAKKDLKIWTAVGAAFAIIYCGDVTMVYFTQLAVVLPAVNGPTEKVLLFDRQTFLMAIDCLGYFFMSLSSFFAAFAFRDNKWLYRSLLWNGALMPVLILAFFYPVMYFVGALWMVTFPMAMINAALFFSIAKLPYIKSYETQ